LQIPQGRPIPALPICIRAGRCVRTRVGAVRERGFSRPAERKAGRDLHSLRQAERAARKRGRGERHGRSQGRRPVRRPGLSTRRTR